jgi:sugar phosphate isomerase/epimerase
MAGTGVAVPRDPVTVTSAPIVLSTASVYPQMCVDGFGYASSLGYDGVEVMIWTDPVSQDASALSALSEHYEIPILAVHAPTLLVAQRVWGRDPWEKVDRSCEIAVAVGASTVVVHPPFRWQREYAATFFEGVNERADRFGVRIAVENLYPWRARNREILAYSPGWDPVPYPYRDVTLDLSHTAISGSDAVRMLRDLGDRMTHLHLGDGTGSAKDEHLVPGHGTQPCDEVLRILGARGWSGTVAVEVSTRRSKNREERRADLAESLAFARAHLAAGAESVVAESRP